MTGIVEALIDALPPGTVLTGEDAAPFATDLMGPGAAPLAVTRPASTEEVSRVMALCHAQGVTVIPQGGNSNVCRMAVPLGGQSAIILSLARMNRILDVDPDCSTLTAEAGATVQAVQDAAEAADRLFSPDWGARGTAMLGGAVATNGGGQNVFRYGTTREQVLGLEVVLPDGRVWNGMRALRKDNSGYDLKQLFIGSEGTLGIITRLVVKLHPRQPVTNSMMAVLTDMSRLMEFLNIAKSIAGDKLVAFELMNGIGVEKALARYPDLKRPLETRAEWYLLLRLAHRAAVDDDLMAIYEAGSEAGLIADATLAQTAQQENNLWEVRDQMIPRQYFPGPAAGWDVSVPITSITRFLDEAKTLAHMLDPDAICYAVGHVGDGNIHYSVFPSEAAGGDVDALIEALTAQVDGLIWSLGGSIVAEHGVGSKYAARLSGQKSELELELMASVRQLFDPKGILNPGKLLLR
ncbi:MAG: FAD-binding oxidoreductase [Pseudomonadota bacterium]|nr:FAD-binding oxidoreductase [Pseudomonadota bacterium]